MCTLQPSQQVKVLTSLILSFTVIIHVTRYCPPATTSPQQAAVLGITKLQGNLQRTRPFYSNNSHLVLKPLEKLKASRSTHQNSNRLWPPVNWHTGCQLAGSQKHTKVERTQLKTPAVLPFGLCWKLRCPY